MQYEVNPYYVIIIEPVIIIIIIQRLCIYGFYGAIQMLLL